jgi:hypothetical protein
MCGGYVLVNGFRSTGNGDQTQAYTLDATIEQIKKTQSSFWR